MNAIALTDLGISKTLDQTAMKAIKGGWDEANTRTWIVNSPWEIVSRSTSFLGFAFHDGYFSKHLLETIKRTRTQTEYMTRTISVRA